MCAERVRGRGAKLGTMAGVGLLLLLGQDLVAPLAAPSKPAMPEEIPVLRITGGGTKPPVQAAARPRTGARRTLSPARAVELLRAALGGSITERDLGASLVLGFGYCEDGRQNSLVLLNVMQSNPFPSAAGMYGDAGVEAERRGRIVFTFDGRASTPYLINVRVDSGSCTKLTLHGPGIAHSALMKKEAEQDVPFVVIPSEAGKHRLEVSASQCTLWRPSSIEIVGLR